LQEDEDGDDDKLDEEIIPSDGDYQLENFQDFEKSLTLTRKG
jgi:hypothetical protein